MRPELFTAFGMTRPTLKEISLQFNHKRVPRRFCKALPVFPKAPESNLEINLFGHEGVEAAFDFFETGPAARPLAFAVETFLLPSANGGRKLRPCAFTSKEMDILLTWNCRHIANVAIQQRLRRLAEQNGYTLPSLGTPEEFMSDL